MTESMIERMARAMFNAHTLSGEDHWAFADDIQRESKLREARAAIVAMREPTQQMRLAGIAEWSRPDLTPEHQSTLIFNAIFRAMIDAALIWPAGSADRAGVPLARDQ